ncbi:hypothetical protein VB734_13245 [Synechococcus sp. BA-124 BA4]|jgi:hypothetical protein|uniref:hypothetical protein n=1 Tax=unclassified Synechococcus TaxID=2626047 RepID=UPI0018CE9369|nr:MULTISPECIES: hypothetical protein [unclassified Synechococcus]MEA5401006.1 hypothetical protein [Synechococcus sp. BA-124 BA4]QPN55394.1 hypothetical protein I1E95_09090 [Synechococcus sp. CBW1107]CAK6689404.1 hypothetical protein BBFGKLBO_00611 [Synechococcus sp. CBW1107]
MPSVPACFRPPVSLALLALAASLLPLPGRAAPKHASCPSSPAARHVVLEQGWRGQGADQKPLARLRQERWTADGTVEGTVFERSGQTFLQFRYTGTWRPIGTCRVRLERITPDAGPTGRDEAEAVLDSIGRPRYSLSLAAGSTITGIWRQQTDAACTSTTLAGTVLSQQQGLSWNGGWRPNAVVQRETWSGGAVQGVALSSYAGRVETASYSGTIEVNADCLAMVVQRDSEGVPYNYRAIVMADGSGYLYLQEDPNDLTIGWLERDG